MKGKAEEFDDGHYLVDAGQCPSILWLEGRTRKSAIDIASDRTGFIERQAFVREGRQLGERITA